MTEPAKDFWARADRDLLARCRENALRTVAEKFEIHKMCAATFEEYQKACQ